MRYIKHPIECLCLLPRNSPDDQLFKFIVFSIVDINTGDIVPSYAQCPNCGNIHKIVETFKSVKIGKDSDQFPLLPNLEEIKLELPDQLRKIMENYKLTLVDYQQAKCILDLELWGDAVVLQRESFDGKTIIKYVMIAGRTLFQVKTATLDDD
jgi:hypothetical protein